jgi:C-terminal processing protease CtpA/Prc
LKPVLFFLGSPADKADLEVADEILEINGASLAQSTHTDVIAHIHNVSSNV